MDFLLVKPLQVNGSWVKIYHEVRGICNTSEIPGSFPSRGGARAFLARVAPHANTFTEYWACFLRDNILLGSSFSIFLVPNFFLPFYYHHVLTTFCGKEGGFKFNDAKSWNSANKTWGCASFHCGAASSISSKRLLSPWANEQFRRSFDLVERDFVGDGQLLYVRLIDCKCGKAGRALPRRERRVSNSTAGCISRIIYSHARCRGTQSGISRRDALKEKLLLLEALVKFSEDIASVRLVNICY